MKSEQWQTDVGLKEHVGSLVAVVMPMTNYVVVLQQKKYKPKKIRKRER